MVLCSQVPTRNDADCYQQGVPHTHDGSVFTSVFTPLSLMTTRFPAFNTSVTISTGVSCGWRLLKDLTYLPNSCEMTMLGERGATERLFLDGKPLPGLKTRMKDNALLAVP